MRLLGLLLEENMIGAEQVLDDIEGCGVIAYIFGVVEVMVAGSVYKGEYSCEGPRNLIPAMPLSTHHQFVPHPKQPHENMSLQNK